MDASMQRFGQGEGMRWLSTVILVAGLGLSGCGDATDAGPTPEPSVTTPAPTAAATTTEDETAPEETAAQETTEDDTSDEETAEEETTGEETTGEETTEDEATEDEATEDDTSDEGTAGAGEADGQLTLGVDQVEGLPLSSSVEDLIAAVEEKLGAADAPIESSDCNGVPNGQVWMWEGFQLARLDGEVSWQVDDRLTVADLPEGLALGTSEADVRASHEIAEETRTGGGWPVLILKDGMGVGLDPATRSVTTVQSSYAPPC